METLHPLSIVNHAHMRSLSTVEGHNTLKKKRYMYWSRLRDKRVAGTPEQSAILSTTYQESCFQQMQGQVTVPRVRLGFSAGVGVWCETYPVAWLLYCITAHSEDVHDIGAYSKEGERLKSCQIQKSFDSLFLRVQCHKRVK